jgi:putative ABC transport system permease protein
MLTLLWLRGLSGMRAGRLAAAAVGVGIAVSLLACLGGFLASSAGSMTARAISGVAVDWQLQVTAGGDPAAVLTDVRADPAVAKAMTVPFATSTGLQATHAATTSTTGPGQVLGLPSDYASVFPDQIRLLTGTDRGVLLAQQTASNLHAAPGDRISIGRAGLDAVTVQVAGIVDLPHADSLFQRVGAPAGSQPTAPPDNVVLLPDDQWHTLLDPLATVRPDQVATQLHIRTRHDLPPDPAAAYTTVLGNAHHVEATLAGRGVIGDNLAAALDAARQDAAYARLLFVFLGLPGAVLACLLTTAVAASGADRRRAEQALLRTRGAHTAQLTGLAVAEALAVGVAGSLLGLGSAAIIGQTAFGSAAWGTDAAGSLAWAGVSAVVGLVIAVAAVAVPAAHDAWTTTVAGSRRVVGRHRSPLWLRMGVDVWLLAGFGLALWATSNAGYQLVLAPEGVPSISVSYWAFAAPGLLWAAVALVVWRLVDLLLRRSRPLLARMLRPVAGPLAGTAVATMSRQRRMIARTVVLLALAVAFAGSTAIFDATYGTQAEVDAQLTNGADVTVTEPRTAVAPSSTTAALSAVPGVAGVAALQHRYGYVGTDLQDLYGIDASTITNTVHLPDAYFSGGTAKELLGQLVARPDAILVSSETVKDFQLSPGDPIRLRLVDAASQQQDTVVFHYAGVVNEYPTAPKDSFFVANAAYIAAQTHDLAVGAFLITTDGTAPATVADRVRQVVGAQAKVSDIQSTRHVVGSSLTAVDLAGLTRVELGFALVLAAGATALLLALGFAERRRTFTLLRALGGRRRQLAALIRAEVGLVTVLGLALGAAAAWVLAEVLVAVLTGVFDPPPDALSVPWPYLVVLAVVAVVGTTLAAARTVAAAARTSPETLRDL